MGLTPLAAWGTRVGRGHDDRILRVETCVMQPSGAPGQERRAPETTGGTDAPVVPPRTGRGPEAVSPVQLLTPPAPLFVSSPWRGGFRESNPCQGHFGGWCPREGVGPARRGKTGKRDSPCGRGQRRSAVLALGEGVAV